MRMLAIQRYIIAVTWPNKTPLVNCTIAHGALVYSHLMTRLFGARDIIVAMAKYESNPTVNDKLSFKEFRKQCNGECMMPLDGIESLYTCN